MMRARNLALLLVPMLYLWTPPLRAQAPQAFDGPDALFDFVTFYYRHPAPERVGEAILFMQRAGVPADESQVPPLLGFFSEVFSSDRAMIPKWTELAGQTTGLVREMLDLALKRSQDPEGILKADAAKEEPGFNDMCWGAFFASGKEVYLAALVDRLAGLSDRKSLMRFVTAGSAQWSLASNALQHPRVKQYLEERAKTAPPEIKEAIDQALHENPSVFQERMVAVVKEEHQKGTW